jgi:hypothetical protein
MKPASFSIFVFITLALICGPLMAAEQLPEKTPDGLVLQKQNTLEAVYIKPGASLKPYDKVMLAPTYVAFKQGYMENYNADVGPDLSAMLTKSDMKRMQDEIASEFTKVLTDVLQKGGYPVVTEAASDVMLIKPALVNLDVAAPDLETEGSGASFVTDSGSVTLYADLLDSVSNAKFATVIDTKEAGEGMAQRATRVSNKADLDALLRYWAGLLVKRLDSAHGDSS